MQERRILVCRFGEDPNAVDIVGIKNSQSFKRYCGVNHHFDNLVTLRIKSCEFPNTYIDIDITHYQKKSMLLNHSETSIIECHGDMNVCHKKYSTNETKTQYTYERKKLPTTITLNAVALTPKQLHLQNYQTITFKQTTPNHTFENFFEYFKSEIDAYLNNVSPKEAETITPFKVPKTRQRKIAFKPI